MGFGESKQAAPAAAPTPAPSKVFDKPWRDTPWKGRDQLLEDLRAYVPRNPDIEHVRILLDGPVGVGKSSFINSINNVFQNKMTMKAQVDSANADRSYTTKYKTHKIENRKTGSYYPFVFNDVMGFEEKSGKGVHEDDLIKALTGHVEEGHRFNPSHSLTEGDLGYNKSPSPSDRTHCLVSLIPADKITVMDDDVIKKMRAIRVVASELGIPQMVILTRVDMACPLVKEKLRAMYLSKYIKETMEKCSMSLGVPVNCIFPVRNYHEEIDLNEDMDVLLLRALKQMVDFGDDFLKEMEQSQTKLVPKLSTPSVYSMPAIV